MSFYNPETTEDFMDEKIIKGNPSGVINPNKTKYPWAKTIYELMQSYTWFKKECHVSQDKVPYRNLSPEQKRAYNLSLAQLIVNDSVQTKQLVNGIGEYITSPMVSLCLIRQSYEECLIEGHEVLTPNGWVDIKDIKENDIILTYNTELRITRFDKVKYKHEYKYDKPLYHFRGRNFEQIVTEGHRIPYIDRNGDIKVKTAKEFNLGKQGVEFINSTNYTHEALNIELSPYEQFLIALQADGTVMIDSDDGKYKNRNGNRTNKIVCKFTFAKTRKISRFIKIINKCNFRYTYKNTKRGLITFNVWVDRDLKPTKDFNKWVKVDTYDKIKALAFIEELLYWDGHRYLKNNNEAKGYDTTVENNAKLAQAIGVIAGYKVHMGIRVDNRKETYKDNYRLSFTDGNTSRGSVVKSIINNDEELDVYCVTVPDSFFVVKYNNKVSITGNCEHSLTYGAISDEVVEDSDHIYYLHRTDKMLAKKNNAVKEMYDIVQPEHKNEPAIEELQLAIIANQILEELIFPGGFAVLWSFNFIGTNKAIQFIERDESGTHVPLFKNIFLATVREFGIKEETKQKALELIKKMAEIEKEWTKYISKDLLGFSEQAVNMYIENKANSVCNNLHLDLLYPKTDGGPIMKMVEERSLLKGGSVKTNFFETAVGDYDVGGLDEDY